MGTYQLVSEQSILTMATPTEILHLMRDDFQRGFKKVLNDNQHMQDGFNNLRKILQEEIQDIGMQVQHEKSLLILVVYPRDV